MKTLELSSDLNVSAPYRLPSRHPSADGGDRSAARENAHAGVAASAPKVSTPALTTASDVKRRQEALLIAYLVNRLAR
jgi:hypothetical protein